MTKPIGNWQKFLNTVSANPISAFAVLVVAAVAGFLGYMVVWQTNILASPTWCAKAMGAEKVLPDSTAQQTLEALRSCNNLLMTQVSAIAMDSHINHSAFALILIILIVVVIAGARASWKASVKDGTIEGNISRDDDDEPQKIEAKIEGTISPSPSGSEPTPPET